MQKYKQLLSVRTNQILVGVILGLLILTFFGYQFFASLASKNLPIEESDLAFNPEGPYVLLEPRRDGNALTLNLKRISGYESFSYQIEYSDEEGIDRGAGDLNTWVNIEKGQNEYSQEILFGTCSQGYTTGAAHCVFDKGVENGTLTLKAQKRYEKGDKTRKIEVAKIGWHMQAPDVALGQITSLDTHFSYKHSLPANHSKTTTDIWRQDLSNVGFTVVNDLSGAPKLPEGQNVMGKVYAFNLPTAKTFPKGQVMIKLAENAPNEAKINRFIESKNSWEVLETKVSGDELTASSDGAGIFAVFAPK